jgi:hypothetical protein
METCKDKVKQQRNLSLKLHKTKNLILSEKGLYAFWHKFSGAIHMYRSLKVVNNYGLL